MKQKNKGKFYRVFNKGRLVCVEHGYNKPDLLSFLKKQGYDNKYLRLEELK